MHAKICAKVRFSNFGGMERVIFKDLGRMPYQEAWDYQEALLHENVRIKTAAREGGASGEIMSGAGAAPGTTHYLLFVEHPPVYTLGKSGDAAHILIDGSKMQERGVEFFRTNRGGDITYHGPGQLVGYPILDLERFRTDLGWYLRSLEEVGIRVLADYGLKGDRSPGETGIWLDPDIRGRARKICAMGVRCSRWITMHGFALNINTDLSWFGNIIPCGIPDKQVTSLERELGRPVDVAEVKGRWKSRFEEVFEARILSE